MNLNDAAESTGRLDQLDQWAEPLANLVKRVAPSKSVAKNMLSGSWLGHPLHPALADVTIGSFSSATVLDLIGGRRAERAADRLVGLGLLSAAATAAAGAVDWSDTGSAARRTGVVHAAANVVGVTFYAASAVARRRGWRFSARSLGVAGMAAVTIGSYLGGHLSYSRGVGVNAAYFQHPPSDWTPVLDDDELADGSTRRVHADGATVLVHRSGRDVLAIGSRCSHAGGPLEDGELDHASCTVTCPWHQSVFRLDTGEVVHSPASIPQTAYETRIANGRIEVRAR